MSTSSAVLSEVAEIKTWVTHWLSEWQGHLLSCPGQLKRESRIRGLWLLNGCHITGRPRGLRGNDWRSFCRDLLHIFPHRVLSPQPSPQVFTLTKSSGNFWNMEKGSLSRGNQYSTLWMNNNFQTVRCKESERHVEKVDLPSYSPPSQSLSEKQSGNLQQQKSSRPSRAGSSWRREAGTSGKLPIICDFLDRRRLYKSIQGHPR